MEGFVKEARMKIKQSETEAGERLIDQTLIHLPDITTLEKVAEIYPLIKSFKTWYFWTRMEKYGNAWDAVSPSVWRRAEELALAQMPAELASIVKEMGFDLRTDPMTARDSKSFLDLSCPVHNPELGDKLLERLILLPFAPDETELAFAVLRFINKGRETSPSGDWRVEAFKRAVTERAQKKKGKPAAKRLRKDDA